MREREPRECFSDWKPTDTNPSAPYRDRHHDGQQQDAAVDGAFDPLSLVASVGAIGRFSARTDGQQVE